MFSVRLLSRKKIRLRENKYEKKDKKVLAFLYVSRYTFPVSNNNTNNMINNKEYYEMFAAVQQGTITQDVWVDYCMKLLADIMEENKDVFVRLKHRG